MSYVIVGNSSNISLPSDPSIQEIHMDVTVSTFHCVKIWGHIQTASHTPIPFALVNLIKVIHHSTGPQYTSVAQTRSDVEGYYCFNVYNENHGFYKILVTL